MTTPDKAGSPEDLGTVEIFGANFSTFTRSILTGLHEVGIPFIQHSHVPHSQEIKKRNPFGLLPVLVHRPDGLYTSPENVVTLFESNAIRRYIDEALVPNHPSRQVLTPDLVPKQAQSARLRARVDQFVSAISMTLFPTIETGVVKPVIRMEKNGADQATISVALEENLQSMELSLGKLEQMILVNGQGQGQWVMGNIFTWADLFLYPILADLKSLPQGEVLRKGSGSNFSWLTSWMERMEARPSVQKTHEGTLAHLRERSANKIEQSKESQSVFKAEDVGLLLVYSEPGEKLSLEEFQDWYDNEHVPLRTKRFTTFRSAARYKVAETFNPLNKVSDPTVINTSWGAFYAISSNALFEDPAYTSLRTERSPREAGIFARLGALDRRSYKLVYDSHQDGRIHNPPKSAEESLKPETKEEVERFSNHIVAHSVSVQDEEEYGKWFDEEHALMLSKCPGWTRTRRYILIDASVVGLKAAKDGKDVNEIPKILGLHEYANQDYIDSKEYKAAIDTPWRTKVLGPNGEKVLQRERKVQNLYRAWDPEVALREYEVKMKGKDKI